MRKILKEINKIEIFRPKRKFNAPVSPNLFVRKKQNETFCVGGMIITIENIQDENVYVRFK